MPSADFCEAIGTPRGCSQSLHRDTSQTSRGKPNDLRCTPAGSTASTLDGFGLRDLSLTRPTWTASYPIPVRRVAVLLHTAFRRSLATPPLCFASTSPPSGCAGDFHPQVVEPARHTKKTGRPRAPRGSTEETNGLPVIIHRAVGEKDRAVGTPRLVAGLRASGRAGGLEAEVAAVDDAVVIQIRTQTAIVAVIVEGRAVVEISDQTIVHVRTIQGQVETAQLTRLGALAEYAYTTEQRSAVVRAVDVGDTTREVPAALTDSVARCEQCRREPDSRSNQPRNRSARS